MISLIRTGRSQRNASNRTRWSSKRFLFSQSSRS